MNHVHQGGGGQRDIPGRAEMHVRESRKQHRVGGRARSAGVKGDEA